MRSIRRTAWLIATGVILSAGLSGQAAEEFEKGLAIGTAAPEFTLKDQNGKDRSLEDLRKEGRIALVFHRSAKW